MPLQEIFYAPPQAFDKLALPPGMKINRPVSIQLRGMYPCIIIEGSTADLDSQTVFDYLKTEDLSDVMGLQLSFVDDVLQITLFGANGYKSTRNLSKAQAQDLLSKA